MSRDRLSRPALIARLVPTCALYRVDWDAATIEEFYQALADLPEPFVLQALRDLVKTATFMPRPAEIRARVNELRRAQREALEASEHRTLPPCEETSEEHQANLALIRTTIDALTAKTSTSPQARPVRPRAARPLKSVARLHADVAALRAAERKSPWMSRPVPDGEAVDASVQR